METEGEPGDVVLAMPPPTAAVPMDRQDGFLRRIFRRRRPEPVLPQAVAEAPLYPGHQQQHQQIAASSRARSIAEEELLTKTTVRMESVMLLVNAIRAPVRVLRDEASGRLALLLFVDSLAAFAAEVWLGPERLATTTHDKGMAQEVRLELAEHAREATVRYSLLLQATEEFPLTAGEGKMVAGMQMSVVAVSESPKGVLDAKVESQQVQIGAFRMDLLEIYGQPHQLRSVTVGDTRSTFSFASFFTGSTFDAPGINRECVVCLSQKRDTLFLPCRHMCLCLPCAESLCLQSDKCPICRQEFRSLLNIRAA